MQKRVAPVALALPAAVSTSATVSERSALTGVS